MKGAWAGGRAGTVTLLSAPIEVVGNWAGSSPYDALVVLSHVRQACLSGIRLFSDQQPAKIRVEDHLSGSPAVWLHADNPDTASIILDVTAARWSQLAYQFGHELGHVLCNSWRWGDDPKPPSQWLEEALVESFSIRGLALLADSWERNPPFPNDSGYGKTIRQYRADLLDGYEKAAPADLAGWLRAGRPPVANGAAAPEGPAVASILTELENDERCVEDLGAVNRWPGRSGVPIEEYLHLWQTSCIELGAPGILPGLLRRLFQLT
jgi:hypothetical protein